MPQGYWDWCGDEMVNYDFPVLVNYVVNAIGDQQIHLVGFSHVCMYEWVNSRR